MLEPQDLYIRPDLYTTAQCTRVLGPLYCAPCPLSREGFVHRDIKRRATPKGRGSLLLSDASHDAVSLLSHVFPSRPSDGWSMTKSWAECHLWLARPRAPSNLCIVGASRAYAELLCNRAGRLHADIPTAPAP